MKITILPEKCIACGLCHLYADQIFDYDDDGIVKFYNSNETQLDFENQEKELKNAIKNCPTRAIVNTEKPSK
ncbi:MAG: ferredoxin [Lactovum sp.]